MYVYVQARSSDPNLHYEHDFPRLHDIARHIIHANETLDVARDTAESMMHGHEMLNTEHPEVSRNDPRSFRQVEWKLYSLSKDLSALKARAVSLNERLQNEINLVSKLACDTEIFIYFYVQCSSFSDLTWWLSRHSTSSHSATAKSP